MFASCAGLFGQAGRIYTEPDPAAPGGITARADRELTHAMAIDRQRVRVYRAELSDGGRQVTFAHLPTGKYDLVFVTKDRVLCEGLWLGDPADPSAPVEAMQKRVATAEAFFNRYTIHRFGFDGDRALLLVERIRDKEILKPSGEKLNAVLRRLEVVELNRATDDWQMIATRHLYREGETPTINPPFFKHAAVPQLGNIRVVESVKELGEIQLPK